METEPPDNLPLDVPTSEVGLPERRQLNEDYGREERMSETGTENQGNHVRDTLMEHQHSVSMEAHYKKMLQQQSDQIEKLIQALKQPLNIDTKKTNFPDFNPDKCDIEAKAWCDTVALCMEERPLTGSNLIISLSTALKGSASTWFSQINYSGMTWNQFREMFLARFDATETSTAALVRINGAVPTDDETISAFANRTLTSLMAKWRNLSVEEIAVSTVLARCVQIEPRIQRLAYTTDVKDRMSMQRELMAFSHRKRLNTDRGVIDQQKRTKIVNCYTCGQNGHKSNECRQRNRIMKSLKPVSNKNNSNNKEGVQNQKRSVICFKCGQAGHIAPQCTSRRASSSQSPSTSDKTSATMHRRVDVCSVKPVTSRLTHLAMIQAASDAEIIEPKQGGDITYRDMVDEVEARGESQIQKFFAGATILLTGGTGFLGKLLVEKLLRTCPELKKIYLLARPKKNKDVQKRLQEQFDDALYERLRKQVPNFMSKIQVVEGDVGKLGLGISDADRQNIVDEVDVIFHGAATLRFNEPLREAVFINVRGTREMMLLARACSKLKAMVHISTAYSNCTLNEIDEVFYESPIPGDKLIDLAETLDEKTLNSITPGLIGDFPNTYAYTKGVAEDVLQRYSQGLPVAVVRPSIVIGTIKEPVAGWIDNVYGPTGVIVGAELGLLHVLHCRPDARASLVPGDSVASACVAAAWSISRAENHQAPPREVPPLYHCVCSESAPITWSKFMSLAEIHGLKCPPIQAMWYYMFTITGSRAMYSLMALLLHWLPAYLVDGAAVLLGKKPQLRKAYKKIEQFANVLNFFTLREWRFHNNNMTRLYNELCDADKHVYDFDTSQIDWNEYFSNFMKGIRVYLLKDPVSTIPEGLKRHQRLKALHYIVLTVIALLFLRFIWFLASFLF